MRDSDEAQAKYERFLIDWTENLGKSDCPSKRSEKCLLAELVVAFVEDYKSRPVQNRSDLNTYTLLAKRLCSLFPDYDADDFGIREIETLRDSFQQSEYQVKGKERQYSRGLI